MATLSRVIVLLCCASSIAVAAPAAKPTRVVVLGVLHAGAQLVAPAQQPAAMRAFIDLVKPDHICIERAPEELARGDFYEFTFEQQDIVVPYAGERRIPLHPIDWLPEAEDERLAFGISLSDPPLVRRPNSYLGFETHNAEQLTAKLLFADSEAARQPGRDFASKPGAKPRQDFARRLFLYRTFLQAMRIARVAKQYPGATVLVVVGAMHKDDIERILADQPGVTIVQPSTYGEPSAAVVRRGLRMQDRFMIATFNLLGLQSRTAVDWRWLREIVTALVPKGGHEAQLFAIRLDQLTKKITPSEALTRYEALARDTAPDETFHWTGVKDRSRLDSSFDPFGNLTLKQRVLLETARAAHQLGLAPRVQQLETELHGQLGPQQSLQLGAYWKLYLLDP